MDKGARVRFQPLAARVDMLDGNFTLPEGTTDQMRRVRMIMLQAAAELEQVFYDASVYDKGRAIATMDLLQQAKNTACDALILPHHKEGE